MLAQSVHVIGVKVPRVCGCASQPSQSRPFPPQPQSLGFRYSWCKAYVRSLLVIVWEFRVLRCLKLLGLRACGLTLDWVWGFGARGRGRKPSDKRGLRPETRVIGKRQKHKLYFDSSPAFLHLLQARALGVAAWYELRNGSSNPQPINRQNSQV